MSSVRNLLEGRRETYLQLTRAMISDERRQELLLQHFRGKVEELQQLYSRSDPQPQDRLARQRMKLALATVCGHLPEGARVLDIGAGSGLAAATLAGLGYRVTAVELIPELVERARAEHGDGVVWHTGPFDGKIDKKATFDAVLCLSYLEFQERAGKELVKMRRLLKPGGLLVMSVPNTLAKGFGFGLSRAFYRMMREPEHTPVRHSFTPERLQRLLGMAGFIFLDYKWLPHGEDDSPLLKDRGRNLWTHRVRLRAEPEFLTLSRTYRPEDTAT